MKLTGGQSGGRSPGVPESSVYAGCLTLQPDAAPLPVHVDRGTAGGSGLYIHDGLRDACGNVTVRHMGLVSELNPHKSLLLDPTCSM